jgi:hypothetical protein
MTRKHRGGFRATEIWNLNEQTAMRQNFWSLASHAFDLIAQPFAKHDF